MNDNIKMRIIDELRGEQEQVEDMLENIMLYGTQAGMLLWMTCWGK